MQRLAGLLCPRSPPRVAGAEGHACALALLVEADSIDNLVSTVVRLAQQSTGCAHAEFILSDDLRFTHPTVPDNPANGISISLADARAQLRLHFTAGDIQRDDWSEADCAWIDLVELRLRELLQQCELRNDIARAKSNEHLQRALYSIADLSYADIDVPEMLSRVHQVVARLTYAENFFVALYDEALDSLYFPYYVGIDDPANTTALTRLNAADYPSSLTFAVMHSGKSLLGPSADLRASLGLTPDNRLGPECIDWLGVPMLEGDNVRGVVVVQSYDENRRYSEDDRSLLAFVAQQTLSAVTRKQVHSKLEAEVRRRTAELAETNTILRDEISERQRGQRLQAALFRITELASEHGSIDVFCEGVHRVISELLNARNFFIGLLSADGDELTFPYFVDQRDEVFRRRRLSNGITEWVIRNRRPLLVTESRLREFRESEGLRMFGTSPKCWLGVPLLLDDVAVGAMVVQSYDAEDDYGPAEKEILQFASYHIAAALERKQAQERLQLAYAELERRVETRTEELRQVNEDLLLQIRVREQTESLLKHETLHDALTGLPNRTSLLDRLSSVLERYHADPTRLFAVLFLDLDRFKVVNDSVGHLLGDELLIEAGRRIAYCVGKAGLISRLGGDEFTVLLEDIGGVEDAYKVAEDVLRVLVDPIRVGDKEIYSSASIGIALAHERYAHPEELLRDADLAMYRAKARGRQRYELFDEQLRLEALNTLDLESEMRRALGRNEFEPYLQPIVRLADGGVLGYEALLRWRHVSRGLLLPADFLAIAEDTGNVEQIDWQIFEQVISVIPALGESKAYVGINVSARHFRSANLTATLLEMLAAYRVPPWRVRIEVTEGALLQDPEHARNTMLRLREAGVLTSLDDFGTGYSSLSYLHRFPLHSLKIDRSFVAELKSDLSGSSAAVVRAIRALAGSLDIEVIAEGIETADQRDALMRLECSIGQGYLFALPRPAAELTLAR